MFLFADDTKIFRRISTKQDEIILQEDINEIEQSQNTILLVSTQADI